MKRCKNCGNTVKETYCGRCGQHAGIGRITFSYIYHEIFHFFSHMEKGFLFTSLGMISKPGFTIKNFVDGKRKQYQPPISYFLIWTTIYILLLYWLEMAFGENRVIDYKEYFGPSATTRFAISHLSLVLMIVIPFQALYLYILLARKTFNYAECIVATIYSLGTVILFQFLFAVIALVIYLIGGVPVALGISDAFKIIYLVWYVSCLVKIFPVKFKLVKAMLLLILAFGTFTLWRIYGFPVVINWFK